MIKVVNIKNWKEGEYIGRYNRYYGKPASPLANKFRIGVDGTREEVIEKYKKWLMDEDILTKDRMEAVSELIRLAKLYRKNGELTLICWCKPEKCHGDVIAELILNDRRLK